MALEEFEKEQMSERDKGYVRMRSMMDFGMGILWIGMGIFLIFIKKFSPDMALRFDDPAIKVFGGICIVYGSFCARRIPYSNMESVRRGIAFWNEHYNRISMDPNITVRLRTGALIKNLVINPPDTDAFIAALQARITAP